MKIELDTHSRRFRWLVAAAIFAAVLVAGGTWLAAGSGPPVYTDSASGVAQPRQIAQGSPIRGKIPRVCNGTDTAAGTATGDRLCYVDPETGLPSGSPGQIAQIVALTATRTVLVTGTQTSIGTQTYSYTQSVTGTGTATATGATGTYTYTTTSTSTGLSTSGSASTGTYPREVCIMSGHAFVANAGSNTVSIYDISDPASPSALTPVTVGSEPRSIACSNGWVYVSNYTGDTISVIDAATPSSAHVESTFAVTAGCRPGGLAYSGDRLYLACYSASTFWTINTANKTALQRIGTPMAINAGPIEIALGGSGYAAVTSNVANAVVLVSLHGGGTDTPSIAAVSGTVNGPVGDYYKPGEFIAAVAQTDNKIYLFNSSLGAIGNASTASGPRDVVIYGAVAIVSCYEGNKIQVFSIASSGNPALVKEFAITGPLNLAVSGDYLWVTRYANSALQSIYIGKYKQYTGTQTTTNTQTVSSTSTMTAAATATQTVETTGTFTSSATGTGTGTEWKATNQNPDPLGTYFLRGCTGECDPLYHQKWNEVGSISGFSRRELTGTCSSGSDALIGESYPIASEHRENRKLWPRGFWTAKLSAKVSGNGAAIRIEAWRHTADDTRTQLFNWTTDAFSNTDYDTIEKQTWADETLFSDSTNYLTFKFFATCSTETTVTMDVPGDGYLGSRIESPMVYDKLGIADIRYLQQVIDEKEPLLPTGYSGAVPVYTGSGTGVHTSKTTSVPSLSVSPPLLMTKVVTTRADTGTATATTVNPITDKPTISFVAQNVTGGDLFLYSYGNQVRFFDAPNPSYTASHGWPVYATTSPTWYNWGGSDDYYVSIVNRFAGQGGSPVEYSPATWISAGRVSYAFPMKSTAAVTTHAIFGICADQGTLSYKIQDISFSVTSSSWTTFSGSFDLADGLLVPNGSIFCVGFYSQTATGTATSEIGWSYDHQSKLNGPWIKSGSNAWSW